MGTVLLIKYLKKPMSVGVYSGKWIVDFSAFTNYLEELIGKHVEFQEDK